MIVIYLLFGLFNIIAIYLISKYFINKKLNNIEFFHVLGCVVINLLLLKYYINILDVINWLNYSFFIIVFLCGIYAMWKLYKLLLIPTRKAKKWFLPDEEKLAIPIEDKEKSFAIGIYFVSLIFTTISLFTKW